MTFATEKLTAGRRLFTIVELDMDFCSLTFSVPPCPAVLAGPGLQCYNTFATCPVKPSFVKTIKTYKFVKFEPNIPVGQNYFPALVDANITSARITPGAGLGARASATVTLQDFSDTDQFTDPYFATRTYTPMDTGTFFGKFLARNPNYYGRTMRVRTGYLTDPFNLNNFQTRSYIIEKIVGPDRNGKVTITGRDTLLLAQDTVAPPANKGKLTAPMTALEVTSFTIDEDGASFPSANGIVRIEKELIRYASRTGNVFSTLTRGVSGTTAVAHNQDDSVQRCLEYVNTNAVNIAYDLLTTFAGVPPASINLTAWNAERDIWLTDYMFSSIITKPTKISTLIAELTEQALFDIWFDDVQQTIRLKAFAPPQGNVVINTITSDTIIQDSVSIEEMNDKRLTRVMVIFGPIDYTQELTEERNFTNITLSIDTEAESTNLFGDERTHKIYSRWISSTQSAVANRTATRILNRYRNTPVRIKLSVDEKNSELNAGEFADLVSFRVQQPSGAARQLFVQIIEAQEIDAHTINLTMLNTNFKNNYAFVGPNTLLTYLNETAANRQRYAFIGNNNTPSTMSNGDPPYLIL